LKRIKGKRWTKNDTELAVLGLPTMVWFLLFSFLPMFGLVIAFKDYRISPGRGFIYSLFRSEWVGFRNFEFLVRTQDLFIILRNTLLYNIAFIVLGMFFSVTFAILLSLLRNKVTSKIYQTLMCFPYFMSWVVAAYFLNAFLNSHYGLINQVLTFFGRPTIDFYMSSQYWPFILIFMNLWKGVGFGMVVYLASIAGIDTSMYEAATIDGAGKFQQVWYITLPTLRPIIIMMFILSVGKIFYTDFGLFYQLSQGAGGLIFNTTATLDTYVFNALRSATPVGMTSAVTFAQAVVCCLTILATNAIVRKVDKDSAII
jgi:putative aldouronate transport system permease protein